MRGGLCDTPDRLLMNSDMAKEYIVSITGNLPFSAVDIPGVNPTVVVGRTPVRISAAQYDRLKAAVKAGKLSPMREDNLLVEAIGEADARPVANPKDDPSAASNPATGNVNTGK